MFCTIGSDNFEYLRLVSTAVVLQLKEPASTIAEGYRTLSVIKLTPETSKRRGLPSNTSSNYDTKLSTIKFIISGEMTDQEEQLLENNEILAMRQMRCW